MIPPKANQLVRRDYDRHVYKERHLIENFFAKLKQFRAIATRYDKTARNFLGAVNLVAAAIWLSTTLPGSKRRTWFVNGLRVGQVSHATQQRLDSWSLF